MSYGQSTVRTAYAVHCPIHGKVYLTKEEYSHQLGLPHNRWTCPVWDTKPDLFGLCGYPCEWDDENFEEVMFNDANKQ